MAKDGPGLFTRLKRRIDVWWTLGGYPFYTIWYKGHCVFGIPVRLGEALDLIKEVDHPKGSIELRYAKGGAVALELPPRPRKKGE